MVNRETQRIEMYADMMTEGFKDDPGIVFQTAASEKAETIIKAQCRGEVEAFWELGLMQRADEDGFLMGFRPEETQTEAFAKAMERASGSIMEAVPVEEIMALQEGITPLAEISKPDWYVKFLGDAPVYILQVIVVKPEKQGTGVFRRLMTPLIKQCAEEKRAIALQTHNPDNVPIYEHYGFELMESVTSEKVGITCYNMLRKEG